MANNGFGILPSSMNVALNIITHRATENDDDLSGTESINRASVSPSGWAADSWHSMRVDWTIPKGNYAKLAFLWREYDSTDNWQLVDSSVFNCQAHWLEVDDTSNPDSNALRLPGVFSIQGVEEDARASTVTIQIAKAEASGAYDYDSDLDSFGVLRPNRMMEVYTGFNTQGAGNTPADTDWVPMGRYFIDNIRLDRSDTNDILSVSARDTRKKAEQQVNLLFPNVLSYDLAGYDSDAVWDEPMGTMRWVAYDSWTLAEAIRDLLSHSGFTTEQLWAKDAKGNFKIEENDIRLGRSSIFRLKLPVTNKDEDLKYSFQPGAKVLDLVNGLVQEHGYEWGMDASGDAYCREANNPTQYAADASGSAGPITYTSGTWNRTDNIKSLAGVFYDMPSGTGLIDIAPTENFEAYNLIFERQTDPGVITVLTDGAIESGWEDYSIMFDREWFHRDGDFPASGINPTVLEVGRALSDSTHTIQIEASGNIHFGGVELFSRDRENPDITYDKTRVLRLNVDNTDLNIRNDVIIAGAERGTDTDDLIHSRSTDILSMARPSAKNYVGEQKMLIAPNPALTRQDVVDWTSLAVLKRHRTLADIVEYQIPGAPHLELGDCINITDADAGFSASNDFWVNRLQWRTEPGNFTQSVRLSPYKPYPSFKPVLEASAPSGVMTDFVMFKTDGSTLDPDATPSGYFNPAWADRADPIFLQMDFDLWNSSYVTLEVKDAYTNKTQMIQLEDELLEPGQYTYFWNGRWYSREDESQSYSYAPRDPDQDAAWWSWYQDQDDLHRSGKRGRTGYSFIEATYSVADDDTQADVVRATNTDKTTVDYFETQLSRPAAVTVFLDPNWGQPVNATQSDGVPFGGRADVYNDEHTATTEAGKKGFRFNVGHLYEDAKYLIEGWLDLHILVTDSTSQSDNPRLWYYPMRFTAESFSRGRHLWYIADEDTDPWTLQLVSGETDFLPPGQGQGSGYDFLLNPEGLTVFADTSRSAFKTRIAEIGGGFVPPTFKRVPEEIERRAIPFRVGYLDDLNRQFGGGSKVVNASWSFEIDITSINRAGEHTDTHPIGRVYRLEDSSYSSNKHCVFPSSDWDDFNRAGGWASLRNFKYGSVNKNRMVHFTSNNSGIGYAYD
jgi:hypothetical protein